MHKLNNMLLHHFFVGFAFIGGLYRDQKYACDNNVHSESCISQNERVCLKA